jgi:hypothetical protein
LHVAIVEVALPAKTMTINEKVAELGVKAMNIKCPSFSCWRR